MTFSVLSFPSDPSPIEVSSAKLEPWVRKLGEGATRAHAAALDTIRRALKEAPELCAIAARFDGPSLYSNPSSKPEWLLYLHSRISADSAEILDFIQSSFPYAKVKFHLQAGNYALGSIDLHISQHQQRLTFLSVSSSDDAAASQLLREVLKRWPHALEAA